MFIYDNSFQFGMNRARYAIRVELDSKGFKDLCHVKEWLGLKNYSEVLRHLIREKAREIKELEKREETVTAMTSEEVSG